MIPKENQLQFIEKVIEQTKNGTIPWVRLSPLDIEVFGFLQRFGESGSGIEFVFCANINIEGKLYLAKSSVGNPVAAIKLRSDTSYFSLTHVDDGDALFANRIEVELLRLINLIQAKLSGVNQFIENYLNS